VLFGTCRCSSSSSLWIASCVSIILPLFRVSTVSAGFRLLGVRVSLVPFL
jgi:hypothetical protein